MIATPALIAASDPHPNLSVLVLGLGAVVVYLLHEA